MNARDAERMRRPARVPEKGVGYACRGCGNYATAPMLEDALWAQIAPGIGPDCVCGHRLAEHTRGPGACACGDSACLCLRARPGSRDVLCLECAELRLGRVIKVDDLSPCIGNYATYVMLSR